MSNAIRCSIVAGILSVAALSPALRAQEVKYDSDSISGLGARNIGSATMSGRIAALTAVHENGRLTVYIGAASGGVWKSVNGGTTFKPVFDKQTAQSIGAITIDPKNPKTIWAGTGESWTRNSVSIGDGIYKSTDGGENWTNMGLKDSERISKILIDPTDGNIVYACVPGKLWSDSDDRGLYKTTDGGDTWNKILKGANLSTGCSMISMNSRRSQNIVRGHVGFPAQGLDVPLGRRKLHCAQRQRPVHVLGRRRHLERPGRKEFERFARQALGPRSGDCSSVEARTWFMP